MTVLLICGYAPPALLLRYRLENQMKLAGVSSDRETRVEWLRSNYTGPQGVWDILSKVFVALGPLATGLTIPKIFSIATK